MRVLHLLLNIMFILLYGCATIKSPDALTIRNSKKYSELNEVETKLVEKIIRKISKKY